MTFRTTRLLISFAAVAAGTLLGLGGSAARAQQKETDCAPIDRIIVEKSKRTMTLIRQHQEVLVCRIALGHDPVGAKVMSGDNKTPEGLYFVDDKIRNSAFHRALHLTYPNLDDVMRADSLGVSPGGGIMIHGLGKHQLWMGDVQYLFDWTNGCIALTNREIEEIWDLVPLWTPVEIKP
jgi:murein L,D-transpeptidase YafK